MDRLTRRGEQHLRPHDVREDGTPVAGLRRISQPACILHHMHTDGGLQQIANSLEDDGVTVSTFPMQNFRNRDVRRKEVPGPRSAAAMMEKRAA